MLKKAVFGLLVLGGLLTASGDASAHYPYYYRAYRPYYRPAPYYGYQYRVTPYGGYAVGYSGYGPYYNYAYQYYARPVYPAYPAYPVYGPRIGVSYVTPRAGLYIGY